MDILACPAWCHSCLPTLSIPKSALWLYSLASSLACLPVLLLLFLCRVRWPSFLASLPLPSLRVLWDFCLETEPQKNEEWVVRGPALNIGDRS